MERKFDLPKRIEPCRKMTDLYLTGSVKSALYDFVDERKKAEILRASGIECRHRILLVGPPGNGKSSIAEALAFELSLPLFIVRYSFVKTEPCVLFFGEVDNLGTEKAELLLQLDDLPPCYIVVAATSRPELLDQATCRRFELRLNVDQPTEAQMLCYFSDQLKRVSGMPGGTQIYSTRRLLSEINPKNFSEAENFFIDLKRAIILGQREGKINQRSIIEDRVCAWSHSHSGDE